MSFVEWDISQWLTFVNHLEEHERPPGGLAFAEWSAMGPNVPKKYEHGQGWFIERAKPTSGYRPFPNMMDPAFAEALTEAKFPNLPPYRITVLFVSDVSFRESYEQPPRAAKVVDWLNENCPSGGTVVWATFRSVSNMHDPYGGIALVALENPDEFVLAKLKFSETRLLG